MTMASICNKLLCQPLECRSLCNVLVITQEAHWEQRHTRATASFGRKWQRSEGSCRCFAETTDADLADSLLDEGRDARVWGSGGFAWRRHEEAIAHREVEVEGIVCAPCSPADRSPCSACSAEIEVVEVEDHAAAR